MDGQDGHESTTSQSSTLKREDEAGTEREPPSMHRKASTSAGFEMRQLEAASHAKASSDLAVKGTSFAHDSFHRDTPQHGIPVPEILPGSASHYPLTIPPEKTEKALQLYEALHFLETTRQEEYEYQFPDTRPGQSNSPIADPSLPVNDSTSRSGMLHLKDGPHRSNTRADAWLPM